MQKRKEQVQDVNRRIDEYKENRAINQEIRREKEMTRLKQDTEYYKVKAGAERSKHSYEKEKRQRSPPIKMPNFGSPFGNTGGSTGGLGNLFGSPASQSNPKKQRKRGKKKKRKGPSVNIYYG